MKHYKIQSKKAPAPINYRGRGSHWRDLFESMKPGEWFTANIEDQSKINASAGAYLKGRYSCYKIENDTCCFVKIR